MALEAWVLDTVGLTGGQFLMMELNVDPPKAKPEWVSSSDSEWASLLREPLHENREITMKLRVPAAASMDASLDQINVIRDKFRKASRSRDGIPLVWFPNASVRAVTFDVLNGEVTGLPVGLDGDGGQWFKAHPIFTVNMTCKPYWRATAELATGSVATSVPQNTMAITGCPGDIPALGRLVVQDSSFQPRSDVEWGLENTSYNSGLSLFLDSDNLVTAGFSGVGATRAGAYDPNVSGNSIVRATNVLTTPMGICGTGDQTHIGTYRVWARVYTSQPSQRVRFAWRAGDARYVNNDWVTPPITAPGFSEMNLGTINIPAALTGTQKWNGRVDAYESDNTVTAATVDVDYLRLTPCGEGYGRAKAVYSYDPGIAVGFDQFVGASGNLSAHAAPTGGTWATTLVGGATDFTGSSGTYITTNGGSDTRRYAILGATNYGDTEVGVDITYSADVPQNRAGQWYTSGAIARWASSAAFTTAYIWRTDGSATVAPTTWLVIDVVSSGTVRIVQLKIPNGGYLACRLRFMVFTSGIAVAQIVDPSGVVVAEGIGQHFVLATGGALATGKPGFIDTTFQSSGTPPTRAFDNFVVATPSSFAPVIYSGKTIQFRHDDTIRTDAAGTSYGRPQSYRGSRFMVPPGDSRVAVAARRTNLDNSSMDNPTDTTGIQIFYTPRGLVVPRT